MTDATVSMLDQRQRFAERDQSLDVAAEMLRLTLRIAGQALLNIDLSDEPHAVGQAVATVNELLLEYLSSPFPPISIPTASGSWSPGRARSIPFAAPALWLADDAPSHINIVFAGGKAAIKREPIRRKVV